LEAIFYFSASSKIIIILQRFTLNRNEKLKSSKIIQQLFKQGKSFSEFPLRIIYLESEDKKSNLQAAFSASSKNFKKATDRNRIKRLMRETYRLQKGTLIAILEEKQQSLAVFIIYTGKVLPQYRLLYEKMNVALDQLQKQVLKM